MNRVPFARNSMEKKAHRFDLFGEYMAVLQMGFPPLFMDETGATLWSTPRKGRSLTGVWVQAHVGTTPGRHITLAAPMCPVPGFVFHQILHRAMNGHLFDNFLDGLNATLAMRFPQTRYVKKQEGCLFFLSLAWGDQCYE